MSREELAEFIQRYDEMIEEGYSYEEMCDFLTSNIDSLIDLASKYFLDKEES